MPVTLRRLEAQSPGTPLILDENPLGATVRSRYLSEFSGLATRDLIISPLTSQALPDYSTIPFGFRRWQSTRAEAMWHPLMWLPERLYRRYRYRNVNGEQIVEDDDVWSVRVCLELTMSGLYDPEQGAWVDVLALNGLDANDDIDIARVRDWLDGTPDELLDRIDLTEHLTADPVTWALRASLELQPHLYEATWALTADQLIDMLRDLSSLEPGEADDLAGAALGATVMLGVTVLSGSETDEGDHGLRDGYAFFNDVAERISLEGASPDLIDDVADRLYAIRGRYWPTVEALDALNEEPTGVS